MIARPSSGSVRHSGSDTSAVRASEALDWEALTAYLREALPREASFARRYGRPPLVDAPVVMQFPGGHSNLTYLLRFGDVELVVRRPPLGPVAARAHDMAREFRWLAAEHGLSVVEETHYYTSGYFTFFFPLYFVWRMWVLFYHALAREQAAETFCMALRRVA